MPDLLLILLGTFFVCAGLGALWSRWDRNRSEPKWGDHIADYPDDLLEYLRENDERPSNQAPK